VGDECCSLILDARTGEYRKIPPPASGQKRTQIVGLTATTVVWQIVARRSGDQAGPLYYQDITSLPKAIDLTSTTRRSNHVTFHFKRYRTPGKPQILVRRGHTWTVPQQHPVPGGIQIDDIAGKQWYRVAAGDFYSRRVLL